jgi:hypothetical protein
MAKKTGQRNFFRVMSLIGVVVIGGLGYSFMGAAPKLNDSEYHKSPSSTESCLQCHVQNVDKAPIMPHRPMGSCTFCHRPMDQ